MADITINGEVIATLTENAKDMGNSEYLKIIIGSKSYYARLAADISKLFVYKKNKKLYVQKNPIYFEKLDFKETFGDFEHTFNLWLPKGRYLIILKASRTNTRTITITDGKDVRISFGCDADRRGTGIAHLEITDGSQTLHTTNVEIESDYNISFTISRQGD